MCDQILRELFQNGGGQRAVAQRLRRRRILPDARVPASYPSRIGKVPQDMEWALRPWPWSAKEEFLA